MENRILIHNSKSPLSCANPFVTRVCRKIPKCVKTSAECRIQNIGTGFAYDLKFTGDFHRIHPVASKVSLAEYGVIKDGISYLGPGKFIPILLYINYEETDLPTPPIDVKINYWDSANTEYNQKDCLDFTKLEGYPQLENQSVDNIAFYLQGINDTLRDMHEKNSQ